MPLQGYIRFHTKEVYELNPTLENMFERQVFMLKHEGHDLFVPLWHRHVYYEPLQVLVVNNAVLPDGVYLDPKTNDVHVFCPKGKKNIVVGGYELHTEKTDGTVKFDQMGIPRINEDNIYDASKLSDIYAKFV
jgi:hypothetical protein